jgi:hypothetical protein
MYTKMEEVHKTILRENRVALINNLRCDDDIMDKLQQDGILTDYAVEELHITRNRFDRNRLFISILQRRGPNAYKCFVKAVISTKQHEVYKLLA